MSAMGTRTDTAVHDPCTPVSAVAMGSLALPTPTLSKIDGWATPTTLPNDRPPVEPFELDLLPGALARRVADVSERMQCPPDLVAVPLIIALSSIVGRRCAIAPRRHDDWLCVPNLWGFTVAPPGFHKTPAAREAVSPLADMQARAVVEFEGERASHVAQTLLEEESQKVAREAIRKLMRAGQSAAAGEHAERTVTVQRAPPTCRRYVLNDATTEKVGELLIENPCGLLLMRDELAGWFATLDRQGHEADRAFYLESWNGSGSYTYDRIGRGSLHVPALCLSLFGTIQPGPLSTLVRRCTSLEHDGLLQRFQLAVWPDPPATFTLIDRPPDSAAKVAVADTFAALDTMTGADFGADPGPLPTLRFDEVAQQGFDTWLTDLELRLRSERDPAVLAAHLAKFRSLVPSLALLLHLAARATGPVTLDALERATAWAIYLESHARRIYAPALAPDIESARALAAKIEFGEVASGFSLREVYRHCWSQLGSVAEVEAAVRILTEFDWLRSSVQSTDGRPRTVYEINPMLARRSP